MNNVRYQVSTDAASATLPAAELSRFGTTDTCHIALQSPKTVMQSVMSVTPHDARDCCRAAGEVLLATTPCSAAGWHGRTILFAIPKALNLPQVEVLAAMAQLFRRTLVMPDHLKGF